MSMADAFNQAWILVKAIQRPDFEHEIISRPALVSRVPTQRYEMHGSPTDALNLLENNDYFHSDAPFNRRGADSIDSRRIMEGLERDFKDNPKSYGYLNNLFMGALTNKNQSGSVSYDVLSRLLGKEGGLTQKYLEHMENERILASLGYLDVKHDYNMDAIDSMMVMPGLSGNNIMQNLMAAGIDDFGSLSDSLWSPSGARFINRFGEKITGTGPSSISNVRRGTELGLTNDRRYNTNEGKGYALFNDRKISSILPKVYSKEGRLALDYDGKRMGLQEAFDTFGNQMHYNTNDELWDDELDDERLPTLYDMDSRGTPIWYPRRETFPIHSTIGIKRLNDDAERLLSDKTKISRYEPDTESRGWFNMKLVDGNKPPNDWMRGN